MRKYPEICQNTFYQSVLRLVFSSSHSKNTTCGNDEVDERQISSRNDILKDIPRTYLVAGNCAEETCLLNVLMAFSWVKPSIGYCQGLNFLAAVIVKVAVDEETAFWVLVGMVDKWNMENMYTPGVPDLALREYQLNHYFQTILPDLYTHFRKLGVTNGFFISRWFMTLFSTYLPLEVFLPIWDCFFMEGWKVVIKVSMHLLKQIRSTLLQWDLGQISKHLRKHLVDTTVSEVLNGARLIRVSKNELEKLENEFYSTQVNFKLAASELSHVPSENDLQTIRWAKEEIENFNETTQHDIQSFQNKITRLDNELETFSKHYLQITMEYSQISNELENLLEKKQFYTKMLKEMQEKYKKNLFTRFLKRFIRKKSIQSDSQSYDEKVITREDIEACSEKLKTLEDDEAELRGHFNEKKLIYKDALAKAYDLNDRKKKYSGQLCDFLQLIK